MSLPPDLHPAILQAAILAGLVVVSAVLARTARKPVYAWWTAAWTLYLVRLLVIMAFVADQRPVLLFWHQVFTGWGAIALLGAALVFAGRYRFAGWHVVVAALPFAWAWIAIEGLQRVELAAIPAVLFLSGATLHTGWVFWRYARATDSTGARFLAATFALWALHHLDYPLLRAQGAWVPWGYYLDIVFALAVGAGMLLLVIEDLRRGVGALVTVSRELATSTLRPRQQVLDALLSQILALPAVRGAAYYARGASGNLEVERGAGACADWHGPLPSEVPFPFSAVLRVQGGTEAAGALLVVADQRDPFAALDGGFLVALGEQIGAALDAATLSQRLGARTRDLERLSVKMVRQHEGERRRFARELHDETAQVLAAVKMELAGLRDDLDAPRAARLDDALALLSSGIRGIRAVARDLRPTLLDDLGLVPALASLAQDFRERSGLAVHAALPEPGSVPALSPDGELAMFRALQEALANVARHAEARGVWVTLRPVDECLELVVRDDGRGLDGAAEKRGDAFTQHVGLAGMRERVAALGGRVTLANADGGGATLSVRVPIRDSSA